MQNLIYIAWQKHTVVTQNLLLRKSSKMKALQKHQHREGRGAELLVFIHRAVPGHTKASGTVIVEPPGLYSLIYSIFDHIGAGKIMFCRETR